MALRALQLTTRALRPRVMTLGAQSALRTRFASPMVPSFQHINSRHIWSLPYLKQYVAAKLRPEPDPDAEQEPYEAMTFDKRVDKDGCELWIPRRPPNPNYDQFDAREGYRNWRIRLAPGLTKRKGEKLGKEVEDHLNNLKVISSRVAEAGPYRVLVFFSQALGRTPSSCQLIFNFPEGEDPLLEGFMIMDVFDKIEKEERACGASLQSPTVLPDKPTPSKDAEPIKYDMHMDGKDEIWTPHYPANYDQLIMREGYTPWVLHLKKGLTKKRCESLAKEVEDHLNEEASSPEGNAQVCTTIDGGTTDSRSAGPYRVLTLFVGEFGGAPSHCQLIFNYPKGENPRIGGFLMTNDFGRVDKTAGPLRDAGLISGIGQNERLSAA